MWPLPGWCGQAAFSASAGSFSNERQNRSVKIFFRDSEHAGEVELEIVARQSALARSATGICRSDVLTSGLSRRTVMETLSEESKPRRMRPHAPQRSAMIRGAPLRSNEAFWPNEPT